MQQSEQEAKAKYESAAKELEDAINAVTKTKEQDKRIQDAFGVYVKEVVAAARWQMADRIVRQTRELREGRKVGAK